MPRTLTSVLVAGALAVVSASPTMAQTFGSDTPNNAVLFGRDVLITPLTGTVAETFSTPAGAPLLESFSFFLSDNINGSTMLLEASIFAFSGDHVVGSALYTSATRSGSDNLGGYDPLTFTGVNLLLTPGTVYAVLLRATDASPDGSVNFGDGATNFFGTVGVAGDGLGDTFTLGDLFTSEGRTDAEIGTPGAFVLSNDSQTSFGRDAAILMTFGPSPNGGGTVTPEPASLVLITTGFAGVFGIVRRRALRQRNAA